MSKRGWYRIEAKADEPVAELEIFGGIGQSFWDDEAVSAKQFLDDLRAIPASATTIRVRVNSLGGDVFDAVAIANALRDQAVRGGRRIETVVEGIAASAASIVIMAGDTIQIGDNALVMVHNPWTLAIGNAADFRKLADTLDTVRGSIVATYKWHSELSDEAIVALMDAETWMDADEAIANGFATEKVEGLKAAASLDPRAAAKLAIPEPFKARVDALLVKPTTQTDDTPVAAGAAEILRACREADCLDLAESFVTKGATLADVQASVSAEREKRQQSAARAQAIAAICATAKLPELAQGYIAASMSEADVRAHVTTITARLDKAEIDTNLDPDKTTRAAKARINTQAVYAARNARPTTTKEH